MVYIRTISLVICKVIASVISLCLLEVDSYGIMTLNAFRINTCLGLAQYLWSGPFTKALFIQWFVVLLKVMENVWCTAFLHSNYDQASPAQHAILFYILLPKPKISPNNRGCVFGAKSIPLSLVALISTANFPHSLSSKHFCILRPHLVKEMFMIGWLLLYMLGVCDLCCCIWLKWRLIPWLSVWSILYMVIPLYIDM